MPLRLCGRAVLAVAEPFSLVVKALSPPLFVRSYSAVARSTAISATDIRELTTLHRQSRHDVAAPGWIGSTGDGRTPGGRGARCRVGGACARGRQYCQRTATKGTVLNCWYLALAPLTRSVTSKLVTKCVVPPRIESVGSTLHAT